MSLSKRLTVLLGVVLVVVVALAVGAYFAFGAGSDDDGGGPMSEGRASQISHAALLEPQDLSGDWVLFTTDNFRNDDSTLPDIGNCAAARTLAADMSRANINRAQRALQLELPGYAHKAQVEMHVRIFDKESTARDFLQRHRTLMTGDGYIRCLADGLAAFYGPNARVRFGDARGRAPRDGVTSAFDQDLQVQEAVIQLHTDSYAWVQQNAFILLLVSGPRQMDSSDFVKEALDKTQTKVDTALQLPER